jgi:NAD(P)-dependent dehydrogenase (short-subunit alcohol dehydrogenase family)
VGREVALGLARRGATVLVACRRPADGDAAAAAVDAAGGRGVPIALDLADLASVARASEAVAAATGQLDVAVLNAGVMAVPQWRTTAQGFELQLGVNHLGHVALAGRLLPLLRARPGSRVVAVTSLIHHRAQLALDDLQLRRRYRPWAAYAQSKLANVLFGLELDRRSRAGGWGVAGVVAHPGISRTHLARNGPLLGRPNPFGLVVAAGSVVVGQGAARGAQPLLQAAVGEGVEGGSCWGPGWPGEVAGPPARVEPSVWGRDEQLAAWLWDRTEELTGVRWPAVPGDR